MTMDAARDAGAGNRIAWTEEMSVGVPEIDADHQILMELIAQIDDAAAGAEAKEVTGSVLGALLDYTDFHFQREERLQEAIGFPETEQHKRQHAGLKRQVLEFLGRYSRAPDTAAAGELSAFLHRWLVDHILTQDMRFKPYALAKPDISQAAAAEMGVEYFLRDG